MYLPCKITFLLVPDLEFFLWLWRKSPNFVLSNLTASSNNHKYHQLRIKLSGLNVFELVQKYNGNLYNFNGTNGFTCIHVARFPFTLLVYVEN